MAAVAAAAAAAAEETKKQLCEAYPMQGGDGPYSYATNSTCQRGAAEPGKELVSKAIAEELGIEIVLCSNKTFKIADLGCSVGPNTFFAVENILEAVEIKYQSRGLNNPDKNEVPEFQVFFNDHTANDFNLLFKTLPRNRHYYAAGVPGSFYGRLFPKDFIHIFHSSFALQWLSRVPKSVLDRNSPAWNKGHIHYADSSDEVVKAYEAQHAEDMDCFLHARAQEIVCGGLMTLIVPGRPHGTPHSHYLGNANFQLLESCLMDMVRKGVVSEEKVGTFNLPLYDMSPCELEAAVERNGGFVLERIETLPHVPPPPSTVSLTQLVVSTLRAVLEGLIKQQFGEEILEEFFDLYLKKLEEDPSLLVEGTAIVFLAVLKRNEN